MSKQYDEYLSKHISAVIKAYDYFVEVGLIPKDFYPLIHTHDASKYSKEEYRPYDSYFYGPKGPDCDVLFDHAWLHHIHNNPHHWQYWLLHNDDGSVYPLEMDGKYIIEMLCDWFSFGIVKRDPYAIFDWYNSNKDKIILGKETRGFVEHFLDRLKEKLDLNPLKL